MNDKILFLLSTHGDEGFSVNVLKKLEKKFSKEKYNYEWIISNEKAYEKNLRYIDKDLNRSAPGDLNSKKYEVRRAAEIIQTCKQYDYVIDIHGTVSDSGIISIIPYPTFENLLLSAVVNIKKNIIWYSKSSLESGPIVQFCNKPAIEIECGEKSDPKVHEQLFLILSSIISRKNFSLDSACKNFSQLEYYHVQGKQEGPHDSRLHDFMSIKDANGIEHFTFLTNQYPDIQYYKLKKIDLPSSFLC